MQNDVLVGMGKRISLRRKSLGLTQENLAEKMDVSIQMISNLELGKKAIRPENLIKLCNILEISSDYILTGKSDESRANSLSEKILQLQDDQIELIEVIVSHYIKKN